MSKRKKIAYGDCDLWWPEQAGAHGCVWALGALALGIAILVVLF
jgi:hypothetical protein